MLHYARLTKIIICANSSNIGRFSGFDRTAGHGYKEICSKNNLLWLVGSQKLIFPTKTHRLLIFSLLVYFYKRVIRGNFITCDFFYTA